MAGSNNPEYTTKTRCDWVGDDALYREYHDREWGVPCYDDRTLFEFLILEGAQAGLSWITILRKRENYRRLFDNFDAERIARYDDKKIASLLADPGIVRNRLKVESAVTNARLFLDIRERQDSFTDFIWRYVDGRPVQNKWPSLREVPASTERSDTMSHDMKKMGFKFVGTTICYAFMQAVGMINDHTVDCFRHQQVMELADRLR
jgi:DNA-3-methyladenine glycosylase I